jgi:hypothetical protein
MKKFKSYGKEVKLKYILTVSFIALFSMSSTHAQLSQSYLGLQGSVKYGFLLPHRSTMEHLVQGHTTAFELGTTFQFNGDAHWHHRFSMPTVSFTLSYMEFGNSNILGSSVGTQIVTYLPYFRSNGWSFGSQLGAGIGYITKKFDQSTNPKNNAIGSLLNALVTFGFKLEKQFKRNSIGLEVNMSHLSNGAYKLPNLGLNVPLVGFQYTHYFHDIIYTEEMGTIEESPIRKWSFFSQLIVSTKQIYPTGGSNYGVASITNFLQYQFGKISKVEAGIDVIYNQSIIRDVPGDYGPINNIQMGGYLAYILPVNNVDFLVGMGRYIYNPLDPKGMFYHKLGTRIKLTHRLQANIVIKAHWAKADYFEYGITYRW